MYMFLELAFCSLLLDVITPIAATSLLCLSDLRRGNGPLRRNSSGKPGTAIGYGNTESFHPIRMMERGRRDLRSFVGNTEQ